MQFFSSSCLSLTNWIWNCNSSLRTKFSSVIFAIVVAEWFEYFEIWWKSHDQKSYYLYICNLMFVPISLTESLKKWMTIWNSYWWILKCELETSQKHEESVQLLLLLLCPKPSMDVGSTRPYAEIGCIWVTYNMRSLKKLRTAKYLM